MKQLRILMVTGFPCIRALKESQALKNKGHSIVLLCSRLSNNPAWNDVAEKIFIYSNPLEFEIMLRRLADTSDIVHGHNEPNWHIALATQVVRERPIVYDCHDFTSLYMHLDAASLLEEKICFEKCHAVVHVSNELCAQANRTYAQKKSLVLYSLPSIQSVNFRPRVKLPGLHVAYEGGITASKTYAADCRYYIDYFHALAQSGATVHIYPSEVATPDTLLAYRQAGGADDRIRLYATQVYEPLLRNLSAASWGFTGFYRGPGETDAKTTYLDHAMPNKLFEYLFVGLTPVVLNCQEAGRFVTEHNVGYHVKDIEEFIDVIHNAPQLVQNLDRSLIDMDAQIARLEALYADLLG